VRRKILDAYTQELSVSEAWLEGTARDERIRPGHVQRAARFAKLAGVEKGAEAEEVLSRAMQGALHAEGAREKRRAAPCDACAYDPALVNADMDPGQVVAGLGKRGKGTLCLYGPPGTGKSAFAAFLADRLGMPLASHRASDLLSMWVGGTEHRLADMFQAARDERAVLFLDEADSFLQSRERALRSWEVTQVNELLVQMEEFDGIFICATNLMDSLDPAVFRRFALKVRFDPLRPDQRWKMLCAVLGQLGGKAPRGRGARSVRAALDRLDSLTPGDFAAVARRTRILGQSANAQGLLSALEGECRAKPDARVRSIGFAPIPRCPAD
jgi:transitional endoplasmic reticulum ATPase